MVYILPNPSLITEPVKTADMICISSRGACGEEGFRCLRLKEARLAAGKTGSIRSKGVDMVQIAKLPIPLQLLCSAEKFSRFHQKPRFIRNQPPT
jgi:hypothetical protein